MEKVATTLAGAYLLKPKIFADHRGYFMESYNHVTFNKLGFTMSFIQDNHSLSKDVGTIRGLHYQLQAKAQTKLIRVTAGEIYDVIVDIRKGSPTYGKWEGFILNAKNKWQLLVPKGFAHGFCTLEENTEVQYKVDTIYSPDHDRGIAWNDKSLKITWPIRNPILSEKDRNQPRLDEADNNFIWERSE